MATTRTNPYLIEMPDGSRIERSYRIEDDKPVPFGSWKWVVYDPDRAPKRKKLSLYTKDKGAATDKARDYIKRRTLGLFDPWEDKPVREGTTVAEAATAYLKAKRAGGASETTLKTDANRLDLFMATVPAGAALGTVGRKHVERFLDRPKKRGGVRSTQTKNRDLATLRHFFEWCVTRKMLGASPAAGVKSWKKEANRRDHATADDVAAVLRAITAADVARAGTSRQWLVDWIVFGFGSGLRPGEMRDLRWSAVHLAEGRVEVGRHRRVKTRKSRRSVKVAGDALAVLVRRHAERTGEGDGPVFTGNGGGPVSVAYATKQLKAFAEKAGLSKTLVSYGLRHGFGTNMTAASKPVVDVAHMMGTSVGMLEDHYAHYDPRRGAAHVEDVYGDGAGDPAPASAQKAAERFALAAELHRAGRLTLAEAARVAELEPEAFQAALRDRAPGTAGGTVGAERTGS